MQIRSALLLAFFLVSSGCISTLEEPGPMKFPQEPVRRERPAPELIPAAEDVTPTERWKAELAKVTPQGWTVGEAVDQLEAPEGWSRIEGGRGISYTIQKGEQRFTIWFLPKDWKGKDDHCAPVKFVGSNTDWHLYCTTTTVTGWSKPQEDVARAFKVAFPARG